MQLVIDIDDYEYTEIKEDAETFRNKGIVVPDLYKVIESGTPLPKVPNNATNGDVIKALFPDCTFSHGNSCSYLKFKGNLFTMAVEDAW